jgi:hypothetical protein
LDLLGGRLTCAKSTRTARSRRAGGAPPKAHYWHNGGTSQDRKPHLSRSCTSPSAHMRPTSMSTYSLPKKRFRAAWMRRSPSRTPKRGCHKRTHYHPPLCVVRPLRMLLGAVSGSVQNVFRKVARKGDKRRAHGRYASIQVCEFTKPNTLRATALRERHGSHGGMCERQPKCVDP